MTKRQRAEAVYDHKPNDEVYVKARVVKFTPERAGHKMVLIYCEYWDEEQTILVPISDIMPPLTKALTKAKSSKVTGKGE